MPMKHWKKIIFVIFNNNNLYDTSINAIVIHNLMKGHKLTRATEKVSND